MCINCDHDHPILPPGLDRALIVLSKGARLNETTGFTDMPATIYVMARTNEELEAKVNEVIIMDAQGRDDGSHFHIVQGQGALGPVLFNHIGPDELERWDRVLVTGNDAYDREIELERISIEASFAKEGRLDKLEAYLSTQRHWWVSVSSVGVPGISRGEFQGVVIVQACLLAEAKKLVHNQFIGIEKPVDVEAAPVFPAFIPMIGENEMGRLLNREETEAMVERQERAVNLAEKIIKDADNVPA